LKSECTLDFGRGYIGKIKSYLKRDSDVLVDALALFFGFSIGVFKIVFENQQLYSRIFGASLLICCIAYIVILRKNMQTKKP